MNPVVCFLWHQIEFWAKKVFEIFLGVGGGEPKVIKSDGGSGLPPDSPNKVRLDNCCNTYLFSLPSWRTLKQTQLSMNLLKPCQGQIAILVHLVLVAEG